MRSCRLVTGATWARQRGRGAVGVIKRCLYECLFQSVVIVMPLRRVVVVVVQRRWLLLLLLQLLQQLRAERRQPLHPRGHQHAGAELPRSAHRQSGGAYGCCCRRRPSQTLCGARGVAYSQAAGRVLLSHLSHRSHGQKEGVNVQCPWGRNFRPEPAQKNAACGSLFASSRCLDGAPIDKTQHTGPQ